MHEWQGMETIDAANLVSGRDPRECPWGVFGMDDDGVGLFLWFASPGELLDFAVEVEPRIHLEADDDELPALQGALQSLRANAGSPDALSDGLRQEFNAALCGYAEYQWWGRFADLCEDAGAFASELREELRDSDTEEAPDNPARPITPDELESFIEYLTDYGH